jgi:hypothetical protein
MKRALVRVEVSPGLFSSERTVRINAGDRSYQLLVDASNLCGNEGLWVHILDENDKEAIVDLPQETFSSGSRIRLPQTSFLPEKDSRT